MSVGPTRSTRRCFPGRDLPRVVAVLSSSVFLACYRYTTASSFKENIAVIALVIGRCDWERYLCQLHVGHLHATICLRIGQPADEQEKRVNRRERKRQHRRKRADQKEEWRN